MRTDRLTDEDPLSRWISALAWLGLGAFLLASFSMGVVPQDEGSWLVGYSLIFDHPEFYQSYVFGAWLSLVIGGAWLSILPEYAIWWLRAGNVVLTLFTGWLLARMLSRFCGPRARLAAAALFILAVSAWDYRYLDYLMLSTMLYIGAMAALTSRDRRWALMYGLAGALLSLNVFVRFPSIVSFGLVIVIPWRAYIEKRSWRDLLARLAAFAAGAIVGVALAAGLMAALGHLEQYVAVLSRSIVGGDERSVTYGPITLIRVYLVDKGWQLLYGLSAIAATVLVLKLVRRGSSAGEQPATSLRSVLALVPVAGVFLFLHGASGWQTSLTLSTGVALAAGVFYVFRHWRDDTDESLVVTAGVVACVVWPFGAAFPNYTSHYGGAILLGVLAGAAFAADRIKLPYGGELRGRVLSSVRTLGLVVLAIGFVLSHLFTDAGRGYSAYRCLAERGTLNHPAARCIAFPANVAAQLNPLLAFLDGRVKPGEEVFVAAEVPLIDYLLGTLPYNRNPWPLQWGAAAVEGGLRRAREATDRLPIVITGDPPNKPPQWHHGREIVKSFLSQHAYATVYDSLGLQVHVPVGRLLAPADPVEAP